MCIRDRLGSSGLPSRKGSISIMALLANPQLALQQQARNRPRRAKAKPSRREAIAVHRAATQTNPTTAQLNVRNMALV
eukprot:7757429-Alexandrium_andersonii.AAC.1